MKKDSKKVDVKKDIIPVPPTIPPVPTTVPITPDTEIIKVIPGQLIKREIPIHTVLIIKDGCMEIGDISKLSEKNYFYRVHSRVDGLALIDFDKTNMVPITKDILNRQHTFIEIKYLKFILIISFLVLVGMIVVGFLLPRNIPTFDSAKNEILTEIRKVQKTSPLYSPLQEKNIISPETTTTTNDSGYSPIYPENIMKNTHKNTPNYAN